MVPLDEARNVVFVREAKNIGEERRTDLVRFLRQQPSTHLHKLISSASTIIISTWLTAKNFVGIVTVVGSNISLFHWSTSL